ncbi:MAG: hypothetical protein AAGF23_03590 [Acidobacteriota bacterium]
MKHLSQRFMLILLVGAGLALFTAPASAQTLGFNEEGVIWGPTFGVSVVTTETGVRLDLTGYPALNPASRRIDTLDLTVKYDDGKKTEKFTREGVGELKEGSIELEGAWKELRFSYKTRRPGTVIQGKTRVACRLVAKTTPLPATLTFESYKEGPRCAVQDASPE